MLMLLLLFLSPLPELWAQGSAALTIYDEDRVPFSLSLDGKEKRNPSPKGRLNVDSIKGGDHRILISYPDTTIPDLEQEIVLPSHVSKTFALRAKEGQGERELSLVSKVKREGKGSGEGQKDGKTDVEMMTSDETVIPEVDSNFIDSYKGASGCSDPIRGKQFKRILNEVKGATFEKERIRTAKELIAKRCVLSSQIAALMRTLNYDDNRLDLAKYAYAKTFDQKNYDVVRKALAFDSMQKKLDHYLEEFR
ncbi:MAG: DUF4476 domain-containing protein [Flavobacteriales bacterium]